HQELGRAPRGDDYRGAVPQGVRRRLSMGASRHRGYRIQRERPGHAAGWTDGCARGDVRGIRAGAGGLTTTVGRLLRRVGLGLVAGAVFASVAQAQVRDTARTKRDTLRGKGDTVAVKKDSAA